MKKLRQIGMAHLPTLGLSPFDPANFGFWILDFGFWIIFRFKPALVDVNPKSSI
jgi:hypothetical protein